MTARGQSDEPWSREENEALLTLREKRLPNGRKFTWAQMAEELRKLFPNRPHRTSMAMIKHLAKLKKREGDYSSVDVELSDLEAPEASEASRIDVDHPIPSEDEAEPAYVFPSLATAKEPERLLIFPDTHAPYHDKRAWDAAMTFAKTWRPTTFAHLCDWIDCFTVSDFTPDPSRQERLADEIAATVALREEVDALGAERKVATLGNHEVRLYRYLCTHAPALVGLPGLMIEERLGLTLTNGWNVVPYLRHATIGKLHVTHDSDRTGVYAIRQTALDYCASVAFGHTHQAGVHYFGDVLGNRHAAFNLGWLGDRNKIDYRKRVKTKDWQHAIGAFLLRQDGSFQGTIIPILEGKAIL
jgi:hypothetical protein